MPRFLRLKAWFYKFFGGDYTYKCGHVSKKITRLRVKGEVVYFNPIPNDLCPQCCADRAVRCGDCPKLIFPGQYVGLCGLKSTTEIPQDVLVHQKDPLTVAICSNCTLLPDDLVGVLNSEGEIVKQDDPLTELMDQIPQ